MNDAERTPLMPPCLHLTEPGPPPPPSEPVAIVASSLVGTMLDKSRGPYVQTLTGGYWYPFDPQPEDVRFADLRALSRINRYGGHTLVDWYTVAEHSVRVARRILVLGGSRAQALAGLCHDAHEAFPPGDQLGPFLRAMTSEEACALLGLTAASFAGIRWVVARAEGAVRGALGVLGNFTHGPSAAIVKRADMELLATERRDLVAQGPVDLGKLPDPLPGRIDPWTPRQAWAEFQAMFEDLGGKAPR